MLDKIITLQNVHHVNATVKRPAFNILAPDPKGNLWKSGRVYTQSSKKYFEDSAKSDKNLLDKRFRPINVKLTIEFWTSLIFGSDIECCIDQNIFVVDKSMYWQVFYAAVLVFCFPVLLMTSFFLQLQRLNFDGHHNILLDPIIHFYLLSNSWQ